MYMIVRKMQVGV